MSAERKLQEIIRKTKRAVVKIGSSVLVDKNDRISYKALLGVARGIAAIQKKGVHLTLVSSGAIASGMQHLGFKKKPHKIAELQACAAVGQPILIQMYQKALAQSRLHVAQILLIRSDIVDPVRSLNARHTLHELLKRGIIPIINENDSVAVDEIRVGDNDNLAALVTHIVEGDLLVLLTDEEGFYTSDPKKNPQATRIPLVEHLDSHLLARASDTEKVISVGGMKTKLEAVKKAAEKGVPTIIAGGRTDRVLERIFAGEPVGTLFALSRLTNRAKRGI